MNSNLVQRVPTAENAFSEIPQSNTNFTVLRSK